MANVMRCDRCGKICERKTNKFTEIVIVPYLENGVESREYYDVCPECAKEIEDSLNNHKKTEAK